MVEILSDNQYYSFQHHNLINVAYPLYHHQSEVRIVHYGFQQMSLAHDNNRFLHSIYDYQEFIAI